MERLPVGITDLQVELSCLLANDTPDTGLPSICSRPYDHTLVLGEAIERVGVVIAVALATPSEVHMHG